MDKAIFRLEQILEICAARENAKNAGQLKIV